jgi:uncharacterized repeat protein (TIGR03803 family)
LASLVKKEIPLKPSFFLLLAGFDSWRWALSVLLLCAAMAMAAAAQTFDTLVDFNGTKGAAPYASLVQGTDGNLYGTTDQGGDLTCGAPYGCGTVFRVTPGGTLTTLHRFESTDGDSPAAQLLLATDGNFYGTTLRGGVDGHGTVFKVTSQGALTTLHSFNTTDGAMPFGGLVQAIDGNFYGTTSQGGNLTCNAPYGCGTIFRITPADVLTTLHAFAGYPNDGAAPAAGLVQATGGSFYGTTEMGGTMNYGSVFKITPWSALAILHSFCPPPNCTEGSYPEGTLVQASDGNFYGTTTGGGTGGGYGTVFKVSPGGTLTTLHSFDVTDGALPYSGLVQATDGNFYGTTSGFGTNNYGTIFTTTSGGGLTTLHNFCTQHPCSDGGNPIGGLIQSTNGNFYGTASGSTADNYGTVFGLSTGLGPFVSFVRGSDKVGKNVEILGQGFTGTTSVLFSGTPANFAVKSDTLLTATVPTGATTGYASVATPGGALKSNQRFRVTPQITSFMPPSGTVGASVTITGASLTQTRKVMFGGVAATNFTVDSDTQVATTVPSGAKTGKIAIATTGGKAMSATSFLVVPQIISFSPPSGPVGTSVTITGVSLLQTTQVTFGGVVANQFIVNSDTQVVASVPTGAVTGPIGITTPGGTATSATSFTVTQ